MTNQEIKIGMKFQTTTEKEAGKGEYIKITKVTDKRISFVCSDGHTYKAAKNTIKTLWIPLKDAIKAIETNWWHKMD